MPRPDVASREAAESEYYAQGHVYVPGTPIFDAVGLWVGVVDYARVRGGADLVMRPGWFAHERLPVSLRTIARADPDGVYLNTYNTLADARV